MLGIHPSIALHQLNVMPSSRPIRQKVRRFHQDKQRVIQSEVDKLLTIEFIKEVEYPDWLANVMVVPKKNGKWKVCIDYTNLNDILMFQLDEEKTAFVTPHGLYCYKVMSFGLKNDSATYQKLMTKIFKPLISRTMEVYINDIVVKSKTQSKHAQHLKKTFRLMRVYNMKLNPAKYTFGVSVGKFLGFMVTQRGIEVNPDQIKVVLEMFALSSKKELQCLTGHLTTLERFISCFTDKPRPFFLTLKGASAIDWTDEYGRAFNEVKHYLTQPPILSSPQSCEQFYMYLVMSNCAIGAVMFRHIRDKEQRLVYYVSKTMVDVETRYSKIEQTTLVLKSVVQKLCLYFQAHQVTVLTNQPLKNIFHKLNLFGQMLKWVIKLSEYRIKYQPRLATKGQVMADFIAKLPQNLSQLPNFLGEGWWILHVDEASRASDAGMGLILQSPTGKLLNDSQLAIGQIQKEYEAKDEHMAHYLRLVEERLAKLGMDIVGLLPVAAAQKKFLLVATDYFNKWVEAKAYASIKDKDVSKFIWKNIVCQLGIPQAIISNGQVEATNKTLLTTLKKMLEWTKEKWVNELPEVLWAYRTTLGRPIETTPFALIYGMDVVIPTEIGMSTAKTFVQGQKNENHELERHLDWVDETRKNATI
ncbi:Retrovirus-related Pol polyprotein from transposon 17.6 [Vitis vinifera]|uniref:Retrovirus-related Pol polyprotein from transposon 17.6 n=1 Tax=Vitis vinifera TaxID=29760 RepID=A0A438D7D1_VITVI|nr:Retrovirus-related Pol polyprotein from transposon 17.6 [Vitis vinifera]